MSTEITLTLPDDLYQQAQQWADLTQRDLSEVLKDALSLVLTPLPVTPHLEKPVADLADDEVLTLSQMKMETGQGQRLTDLLAKQREGVLSSHEEPELLALMQQYRQMWVRQSEALAEAVRRGLRQPSSPLI